MSGSIQPDRGSQKRAVLPIAEQLEDAFLRWMNSLDVVLRMEVRIMLLGIEDMEAYLDELEKSFARGGAPLH